MKKRIITLLFAGIILLAACANVGGSSNNRVSEADETAKYNAYIELLNFMDGWFDGMIQAYFNIFGEDMEPNFDNDFSRMFAGFAEHDLMAMHGRHHRNARSQAANAPDWGEADARMLILADAVEAMIALYFVEMTEYYSSELFQADNFQQGREMHTRFIEYYDAMWDAFEEFIEAFQPILLKKQGADLPIFYEHDLMIRFHSLRLIITGMEILALEDQPVSELEDLIQLFSADVTDLLIVFDETERHAQEGFSDMAITFFDLFLSAAVDAEEALTRALEEGRSISTTRFSAHLDFLISRYNVILSL